MEAEYDLKNEIISEIKRVAKLLNTNKIGYREFRQHSKIKVKRIVLEFGSWNNALREAGLEVTITGKDSRIDDQRLFEELDRVAKKLQKMPTILEMEREGKYYPTTYTKRFGGWPETIKKYKIWSNPDILKTELPIENNQDINKNENFNPIHETTFYPKKKNLQYGELINFRGLIHAPVNEQGVVYLFGMLSSELGFIIESIRTGYPDCEGKRRIKGNKWERVTIEFEYESINFKEHGHNPKECDVIVCWVHNWEDCSIEVISLKNIIEKISENQ